MDESLTTGTPAPSESATVPTPTPAVPAGPLPAPPAVEPAASKPTPRPLNLTEVQELSVEKLDSLARELDLRLYAGRSRHYHILDVIRAALGRGGTVTTEGFLDEVGDSFGFLRSPRLNFLPVPEDVCVPRALIQKHLLRPGQLLAGTVRLPRDREKSLMVDHITTIEGSRRINGFKRPTLKN
jgi:transcription termination factor Rho